MTTRIVVITGTDTGVGKTVLTALLLAHGLERSGSVLAIKPFCSGGTADVELLDAVQEGRMPKELLNPFYYDEPIAPLASQRLHGVRVSISETERAIRVAARQCEMLLVEGSGGLLVPLGEGFTILDVIQRLHARVIVASRNKLGTLNHTLLTARTLKSAGITNFKSVLMDVRRKDFSSTSNAGLLRELLAPNPLFTIPFLSGKLDRPANIKRHAGRLSTALEGILGSAG